MEKFSKGYEFLGREVHYLGRTQGDLETNTCGMIVGVQDENTAEVFINGETYFLECGTLALMENTDYTSLYYAKMLADAAKTLRGYGANSAAVKLTRAGLMHAAETPTLDRAVEMVREELERLDNDVQLMDSELALVRGKYTKALGERDEFTKRLGR